MASPFDIIALAETVVGVGSKIYKFFSSLRSAPQEVRDFCTELELLRSILLKIGMSASRIMGISPVTGSQMFGLETILVCLKGCEAEFKAIWTGVSALHTDRGIEWGRLAGKLTKSVSWVVKAGELEKATRRLDRTKQTLLLGMAFSGIEADAATAQGLSSIDMHIQENGVSMSLQVDKLKDAMLISLQQLEHRLLQRVSELSGIAEAQHEEGDRRIIQLSQDFPSLSLETHLETPLGLVEEDNPNATANAISMNSVSTSPPGGQQPQDDPENIGMSEQDTAFLHGQMSISSGKSMDHFLKSLKPDVQDLLSKPVSIDDLMESLQPSSAKSKGFDTRRATLLPRITKLFNNAGVFSNLVPSDDAYNYIWGASAFLLKTASRAAQTESMLNSLEEMQEAFVMCEREYKLYPEGNIHLLFESLCKEMVVGMESTLKFHRMPKSNILVASSSVLSAREALQNTVTRIKNLSEKVIREVEYHHRRELREASQRLREVDRKQDEVLRRLEEQQRILSGLQQEQKLLATVTEYQKVLQLLQQLLARHAS
ncbi:hypothetical protein M406DRAFT_70047 [Cryphonectria parasitica EP155]|uniref:Fungal N-terminal domain-containing protein n=1 Tax=Cryphonectria parasitica (strain ATCC 38755 / EP155) TaxID=660469 RepID=A0A9P5CR67_CRYP1|nr:uncharacterized protein M406DRAFT_70047 [Cryphonectria parasitica EP155]KAF3767943.1 hypothetical protein M406DRAFT_70047 [Cryphonectria parasitica EP155]